MQWKGEGAQWLSSGTTLGAHIGFANFIVATESDCDSFVGRSSFGGESLKVSEHKSAGS